MKSKVHTNKDDGVALVTLNRPQVHNALDEDMLRLLAGQLSELKFDQEIFAVVITGEGKVFCFPWPKTWPPDFQNPLCSPLAHVRDSCWIPFTPDWRPSLRMNGPESQTAPPMAMARRAYAPSWRNASPSSKTHDGRIIVVVLDRRSSQPPR